MPIKNSLPGSFWGVTAYYNPAGYQSRKNNYRKFRESSQRQGLKLIAVEAAFGNRSFELTEDDAEKVVRVRGASVLWQKERLLNIGFGYLPADCDKIACLDADILFEEDQWIGQANRLLEKHEAVQLFSMVLRMPQADLECPEDKMPFGYLNGEKRHALAYSVRLLGGDVLLNSAVPHGHCDPGFAWGFRRTFLTQLPLYDRMILGGGDSILAYGLYGVRCPYLEPLATPAMLEDQDAWIDHAFKLTKGNVGCLDSKIRHLWHGAIENRFHVRRKRILIQTRFNPRRDIRLNPQGGWEWASFKPYLHGMVKFYFFLRREDSRSDNFSRWLMMVFFDPRRLFMSAQKQWTAFASKVRSKFDRCFDLKDLKGPS